jgi:hypothetical protein
MTDRKKPGVAFCASVVVGMVLVGYPLSYGPVAWLAFRALPSWSILMLGSLCISLVWVAGKTDATRHALESWLALWVGR